VGDEELATAVPGRAGKGSKAAGRGTGIGIGEIMKKAKVDGEGKKGKAAPERKKTSHARKVGWCAGVTRR
jgi:hypothetical protein